MGKKEHSSGRNDKNMYKKQLEKEEKKGEVGYMGRQRNGTNEQ